MLRLGLRVHQKSRRCEAKSEARRLPARPPELTPSLMRFTLTPASCLPCPRSPRQGPPTVTHGMEAFQVSGKVPWHPEASQAKLLEQGMASNQLTWGEVPSMSFLDLSPSLALEWPVISNYIWRKRTRQWCVGYLPLLVY